MMLLAMIGLVVFLSIAPPSPSPSIGRRGGRDDQTRHAGALSRDQTFPEETRRRIYNDYRQVARTTVETPLILPQGPQAEGQPRRHAAKDLRSRADAFRRIARHHR